MNKKISAALLFATALMISSCGGSSSNDSDTTDQAAEKPEVKLEKVSSQSIPQTETYTATVESDVKNNIAPNTPYRIEKIYVDVGDYVRKGQVVVQLDESNLRELKLQIENQRIEFNRIDALYQVGGASKSEYDTAKMQLDVLVTQYKQMAQNTQLFSPISGVVSARNYDNGDMYSSQPILTVEQTDPVKLLIDVSEAHYKQTRRGMTADITLDAYEGETFSGSITIVYPSVDASTHTFPVEITINNPAQKVRPGMFARATLNFGNQTHVMVPDQAVVKQIGAGDRYVYVYKNGKVSYNKVELGQHIGTYYEIFSGVNDGDEVVIAGQTKLANGVEVKVVK